MPMAYNLLSVGLITWLALLAGLVLMKMLDGTVSTGGLLHKRLQDRRSSPDPERVLATVAAPLALGFYVIKVLQTGTVELPDGTLSLPDVPESLLAILAASNGTYLAGKISRSS